MTRSSDITGAIARFALETDAQGLPETARRISRLSLIDWTAVTVAGCDEPATAIMPDMAAEEGGREEAFAIGLKRCLPARGAALVNGTASHALDYDDTHFASLGHPSVAVIPAALALADKIGASPRTFQDAVLIGAELTTRIGQWLGRSHYRHGFHVTATAGTFGAAMAGARLLRLNQGQAQNALGIAASRASGIKAQFGTMGKPFHAGMAASNGVEAAVLAQKGFVAAAEGLEGKQGFADTHHGDVDSAAFDGLGQTFVFEDVSYKFHACCHGTHAALEALIELRDEHGLLPEPIAGVEITVHPQYLAICNIAEPVTGLQAKFSYRMVAALALHRRDTAQMQIFSDDICHDARLIRLRDRVRVETDPSMAETAAVVRVTLEDGQVMTAHHDLAERMDLPKIEARLLAKTQSLLGEARAASLWQSITDGGCRPSKWLQGA